MLNAYTNELGAELVRAFGQADADDSVAVVVLTATGRVFCAGADVSAGAGAFDTKSGEGAKNFGNRADGARADGNFIAAMMNCRKPSLVAFNGSAAGVGLTLTLPCHAVPFLRYLTVPRLTPSNRSKPHLPYLTSRDLTEP